MASIYPRGKIWWISFRRHDKTYHKSLKTKDKAVAKRKKNEIELQLAKDEDIPLPSKILIKDCLEQYINHLRLSATEEHANHQQLLIKKFLEHANIAYLSQLKAYKVENYLTFRKERNNISSTTLKHNLHSISAWLNWCVKNQMLSSNPLRNIKSPKLEKKPPRFLTKEEASKLLKIATGAIAYMMAISLYTGVRPGELLRLKWEDFDFNRNILMIPKSKSRRFRTIPFNTKLKTYLGSIIKESGQLFKYKKVPRKQFRRILKEADINKKIVYYDLRHSYASNLIMAGVDIVTVSKLLGHADISTTQIYTHITDKHKEEAARKIDF